jgi:solute carrier family 45 protein 1/2/4
MFVQQGADLSQESANAMASRFVGLGNIAGYLAGYMDLPAILWFFGETQFKDLCAIASIALGGTVLLSCILIRERDPRLEGPPAADKPGVLAFFRKIFTSIKRLPPQTKKVCEVQFCAWIGFFPMLFYTSAYIGEIYAEPYLEQNPNMSPEELDKLYENATREGTFALLIFAIMGLATNVFLPFFIEPTYEMQASVAAGGPGEAPGSLKDYDEEKKSWLDYLIIPGFTLRRAWMFSQILFTASMLCTVFVRTVTAATVLIGLVGITWALTLWAPWAIISAEISRRDELRRAQYAQRNLSPSGRGVAPLDGYSLEDENRDRELTDEEDSDQAGVILGIHNMAIAAPQIIATVVSSIIFRIFQKPRGVPGDHSIAVVLALGGISVLVSAFFIHRIRDDPAAPVDAMCAVEDGEASSRPSTSHSRSRSHEQLPRASLERAALVRNKSFGGMEY